MGAIGPFAGNTGRPPAFTARVDYFRLIPPPPPDVTPPPTNVSAVRLRARTGARSGRPTSRRRPWWSTGRRRRTAPAVTRARHVVEHAVAQGPRLRDDLPLPRASPTRPGTPDERRGPVHDGRVPPAGAPEIDSGTGRPDLRRSRARPALVQRAWGRSPIRTACISTTRSTAARAAGPITTSNPRIAHRATSTSSSTPDLHGRQPARADREDGGRAEHRDGTIERRPAAPRRCRTT